MSATKRLSRRTTAIAGAAAVLAGILGTAIVANAAGQAEGPLVAVGAAQVVPDRYIVTLKDSTPNTEGEASRLAHRYGGEVRSTFASALRGFSVTMTDTEARRLAADPSVAAVQPVTVGHIQDTQNNPPNWGDDRVDQRDLPLDKAFNYPTNAGSGATVYVLDTGARFSHQDFSGRISSGPDYVDNDNDSSDCQGHGTHVAGTAAGTTYGVAKKAKIVALRVLNCQGSGDSEAFIKAIDWVKANGKKPAVVNYSIGCGSECSDPSLDNAVKNLVASGIQFVQAAGNSNKDACGFSPQKVAEAITVGNTQNDDAKNSSSSWGKCLDIFAPGTDIVSAGYRGDTATATMTGTSMASPTVAGAAALYLGANPNASSKDVRDALVNNGTTGKVTSAGTGSPNVLLYTGFIGGDPQPGEVKVANPGNQNSTVGKAVSLENSASGGTSPYTWSAAGLPAGLSIDSSSGKITGTPSAEGSSEVTLTAKDANSKTGTAKFTWTVAKDGGTTPLAVTNPGFQQSRVGQAVSLQVKAAGGSGSYTYKATGLPAGLSINASTGLISGTPSTFGFSNTTVTVVDSAGKSASATFAWFVS